MLRSGEPLFEKVSKQVKIGGKVMWSRVDTWGSRDRSCDRFKMITEVKYVTDYD